MRLTLWAWIVLCSVCMSGMLWFASNKTIVIADVSREQAGLSVGPERGGPEKIEIELNLQHDFDSPGSFCIPLPKGIKPENVVMENRCMTRELLIRVQGGNVDFYRGNGIYGDTGAIREGLCEELDTGVLLTLRMDSVQEYRSTMEGSILTIVCSDPHEWYDFLVVLDPAGGGDAGTAVYGMEEAGLALEVAKQVQQEFDLPDVRLYLTRTDEADVTSAQRTEFAEEVGADLYIRIGAAEATDHPDAYGIQGIYNDAYFIPGFGNADLADMITREVTIAASNRAVGLTPADEGSILYGISVPAMELSMGYLTNAREKALLEQEAYREKLAAGIIKGIGDACGRLKELEGE